MAATVGDGSRVTLSWTGDPTAARYRVYRGTSPGAADRFFESASTTFTDSGWATPAGMDSGSWIKPTVWSVKNLFELKEAERVLVDGNVFENVWKESQNGYAILFTPRNQDNTSPWIAVRDITFSNNIVRHVGAGVNLLGYDDIAASSSQRTQRIRIVNNVFADIGSSAFPGPGHWLLVNGGPADVRVEHNTVVQGGGNMVQACGGSPGAETTAPGFVFANNLARYGAYGVMGDNHAPGNNTIAAYFPASVITANGIACGVGSSGCRASSYPAGNVFLAEAEWQAQFVNFAAGDYRLAAGSRFVNAGTDGRSLGADVAAIDTARGASAAPPVLPSPVRPKGAAGRREITRRRRPCPLRAAPASVPCRSLSPPRQPQHQRAEGGHHHPPPRVDVDAERRLVDDRVADEAVEEQQHAEQGEQQADGKAEVKDIGTRNWTENVERRT